MTTNVNVATILVAFGLMGACSVDNGVAPSTRVASGSMDASVWRTGSDNLYIRSAPSTSAEVLGELAPGTVVTIGCQIAGDSVLGNNVWDFLPAKGGYVSDYYLFTNVDGFVPGLSLCDATTPAPPGEPGGEKGSQTPPSEAPPGSDATAAAAIAEARRYLGYQESGGDNCNQFSTWLGRGCQEWCSDFVNWVWKTAGFQVDGITGYSGTIGEYGKAKGTFKAGMNGEAKPGDAVLWGSGTGTSNGVESKHVGMVTAVSGNSITVIHGNFAACARDCVHESTIDRSSQVGTGANIYGFVSPVK